MTLWKNMKKLLTFSDFFNSSSLLRFEKKAEYKTISGGLASIIIVIVIIVSFANDIAVTLQRTSISEQPSFLYHLDNLIKNKISSFYIFHSILTTIK